MQLTADYTPLLVFSDKLYAINPSEDLMMCSSINSLSNFVNDGDLQLTGYSNDFGYIASFTTFQNNVYIAFLTAHDGDNHGAIYIASASTPESLQGQTANPLGQLTFSAPSLAVFHDKLYIAWQGTDRHHSLNIMEFDAGRTFTHQIVLGQTTSGTPQLCPFQDRLYLAWIGTDRHHSLNIMSGSNITDLANQSPNVLGQTGRGGLGLTVFQNSLYMSWPGTDKNISLNIMSSADGQNFANQELLLSLCKSIPTLTVFQNQLVVAIRQRQINGVDTTAMTLISSADGQHFT